MGADRHKLLNSKSKNLIRHTAWRTKQSLNSNDSNSEQVWVIGILNLFRISDPSLPVILSSARFEPQAKNLFLSLRTSLEIRVCLINMYWWLMEFL